MKTLTKLKQVKTIRARKVLVGGAFLEDWPAMLEEAQTIAKAEDISLEIHDDYLELDGCRVIRKPKLSRESTGTITFRSKDYYFTDDATGSSSYGDIKADQLTKDGFELIISDTSKFVYTFI